MLAMRRDARAADLYAHLAHDTKLSGDHRVEVAWQLARWSDTRGTNLLADLADDTKLPSLLQRAGGPDAGKSGRRTRSRRIGPSQADAVARPGN